MRRAVVAAALDSRAAGQPDLRHRDSSVAALHRERPGRRRGASDSGRRVRVDAGGSVTRTGEKPRVADFVIRQAGRRDAKALHALTQRASSGGPSAAARFLAEHSAATSRGLSSPEGEGRVVACGGSSRRSRRRRRGGSALARSRRERIWRCWHGRAPGEGPPAARRSRRASRRCARSRTTAAWFFARQQLTIVPHQWVPEKIRRRLRGTALLNRCGQHAVVLSPGRGATVQARAPHGARPSRDSDFHGAAPGRHHGARRLSSRGALRAASSGVQLASGIRVCSIWR